MCCSALNTRYIRRYLVLWWLMYHWYFEILSICSLHTRYTAHTRHLCVSILLNTQYFEMRYWLYCHWEHNHKKATSIHPFRYFLLILFFPNFPFVLVIIFSPFPNSALSAVSFVWHADACCRSHGVHLLMSFLFPLLSFAFFLSFFFSVTLHQNWRSYSTSDSKVNNC